MEQEIKDKISILKELQVYPLCDVEEIHKVKSAKNIVALENTVRSLIMKYL